MSALGNGGTIPKAKTAREALSQRIGDHLLACVDQAGRDWVKQLPAVHTLADVWTRQDRVWHSHARRLTPQERPPVGEWRRSPLRARRALWAQARSRVDRLQGAPHCRR